MKAIPAQEQFIDMAFPASGVDRAQGFGQQRAGTTPTGVNVRTYEPSSGRARGAQREGLSRYLDAQPTSRRRLIQGLTTLVGVGFPLPGGGVPQTSTSGRIVLLVTVVGGRVFVTAPGQSTWTEATNLAGGNTPLTTSGVIQSASNNQKLWFADGANWRYYDPVTNSVYRWDATQGALPMDLEYNTPRLICTWRGRTVLSGLVKDPQNWFMSAVGDPTDFDYSPISTTPTQAVAGNNSTLGIVGDVVNSLIPYSDNVLIFGGDHTLWQMRGDPMGGGQLDLISDIVGMAWGVPWCKGPDGTLYFFSNRCGVYSMVPGSGPPQKISQQIDQLLQAVNTGTNTVTMAWDERFQGLHVFVTPTTVITPTVHYFYEARAGAWWTDAFTNDDHNPLCCCVFDGNLPGDRATLIGSWDGYVRALDPDATDDDGTPIESEVVIGPLLTKDLDDVLVKDLQGVLAEGSGDVAYAVHIGRSAEAALSADPVASGTWEAGRNLSNFVRRAGHAVYVRLTASTPWAMEAIRARVAGKGKVRRRGY